MVRVGPRPHALLTLPAVPLAWAPSLGTGSGSDLDPPSRACRWHPRGAAEEMVAGSRLQILPPSRQEPCCPSPLYPPRHGNGPHVADPPSCVGASCACQLYEREHTLIVCSHVRARVSARVHVCEGECPCAHLSMRAHAREEFVWTQGRATGQRRAWLSGPERP